MGKDAFKTGLNLLNKRDYTTKELKEKLFDKGFKIEEIDTATERLKKLNFLNDERYAENYIFFRLKSGYGKRRIKYELLQKGVGEEIVDGLLEKENERAEEFFLKKLKVLRGKKNIAKKIFDAMYRRGFEKDTIFELINKYNVREKDEVS